MAMAACGLMQNKGNGARWRIVVRAPMWLEFDSGYDAICEVVGSLLCSSFPRSPKNQHLICSHSNRPSQLVHVVSTRCYSGIP